MVDKVINKVYSEIINIILRNIDDSDKEEVASNYLKSLYSLYSNKIVTECDFDKEVSIILKIELLKWKNRIKENILSSLKKDESFDIINSLSKKAYTLASLRHQQNSDFTISKEEAKKHINTLIEQLDKVEYFNKAAARHLVSESVIDFEYASGGNTDITSFRIGHLKR